MNNQTVNYIFNITGNANDVVNNINQNATSLNKTLFGTLDIFSGFKGVSVAFQGITSVVQNVQSAIGGITEVGANAELQLMNMKTLFQGNSEAAADMYKRISQYGKVTPYDKAGLIEAQKTMMSFGISGEKAFATLKQIGDIAMGDKQKMQSLSLAFAQMSSSGKLTGQDLLQMINAGFNPLNEISKMTGKSVAVLKEEMSKGAISADMVSQAFASATAEGGLFYKAIDEASQTTAGKMAAIQDTIDEIKVSIFQATGDFGLWVNAASQMAVPIAQLAPLFTPLFRAISLAKVNWGGFVKNIKAGVIAANMQLGIMQYSIASAGGLFKWLGMTAKTVCRGIGTAIMSIPVIGWIAAAITAIIAVVTLLWNKCEGFRRVVMGVWESIKAIIHNVWVVIKTVFVGIWDAVKWCFDNIVAGVMWLYDGVVSIASAIGGFFVGVWSWVTETVSTAFTWIVNKLGFVGTWIREKLVDPIKNAFTGIWTTIKEVFNKIISGLGKLFAPIKNLWNKIFPKDQFKDIGEEYLIGAEKGSESYKKDHPKDEVGEADTSVLGVGDNTKPMTSITPAGTLNAGNMGSSAGTSAGKAQQINITLKSMIETMNFNGGLKENARDVEAQLTAMMARILGMAETAI